MSPPPTRTARTCPGRTPSDRPRRSQPSSTAPSRQTDPGPSRLSWRSRSSARRWPPVVPPDGYWQAIAEVCRRHGVLLIADEVMTGFGRTGRWFGLDHWGIRADILVAAKGAASGYWPSGSRRPRAPCTTPSPAGRGSSMASPTRTPRSGRPSLARSCGSSSPSRWSRRAPRRGTGCGTWRRTRSAGTRRSARSAAWASWSASSSSPTERRANRSRGPPASPRGGGRGRARAGRPRLLVDRLCQRRRRRHHPARTAVRGHRCRAGSDHVRPGQIDRGRLGRRRVSSVPRPGTRTVSCAVRRFHRCPRSIAGVAR